MKEKEKKRKKRRKATLAHTSNPSRTALGSAIIGKKREKKKVCGHMGIEFFTLKNRPKRDCA